MPPKYAQGIMEDFDVFRERVQKVNVAPQGDEDMQMATFRPLHIERMENVSILFADIVGFTHMSSNKSASQLVALLSDLYGRFDDLCVQMSCEKIATLGDCYYCVSGCPEPREDHARSCVLMGLAMINAIEEFDIDNDEQVDMRVGVHSGSVNCGIVGTRKFKFDIFSNDVTLANKMESTGKPGKSSLNVPLPFKPTFTHSSRSMKDSLLPVQCRYSSLLAALPVVIAFVRCSFTRSSSDPLGFVHITESTHTLLKSDEFEFKEGDPYKLPGARMFFLSFFLSLLEPT